MTTATVIDPNDTDARYSVSWCSGVAFYIIGWQQRWEPLEVWCQDYYSDNEDDGMFIDDPSGEGEWVDDPDSRMVRAVMVGDDTVHLIDLDELTLISPDDYCGGCGQIGCAW